MSKRRSVLDSLGTCPRCGREYGCRFPVCTHCAGKPAADPPQTSPYVSIYMARTQAEVLVKALRPLAETTGKSSPLRRALAIIEQDMNKP